MKHISTRAVFEHWNRQRANRPAPERNTIDPVAIRRALGDTFLLSADFADELGFRLAGTRVCALFGRELKGEAFSALWDEQSRQAIDELLTIVTGEASGTVASVSGLTDDASTTEIEMLLLPITYSRRARVCALGVLVPMVTPYWLGAKPVTELGLTGLRYLERQAKTHGLQRLGQPLEEPGRRRHGFLVYSGGREPSPGEQAG
jgi:hypothetical protein